MAAEHERLKQLSEELAEIADRLGTPKPVRPPGTVTADHVREVIQRRRLRGHFLPADLFADPAWDILLALYAAKLDGQLLSVTDLSEAVPVPATTTLRWIRKLAERSLIERHRDAEDSRRVYLELSRQGQQRMEAYFRGSTML